MSKRAKKRAAAAQRRGFVEHLERRRLLAATINPIDVDTSNLGSNMRAIFSAGGINFFSAFSSTTGDELWRTDGTPGGTSFVKDINPGVGHGTPTGGVDLNGIAIFSGTTAANGFELWRTDGTEAGTYMIKDIRPGPSGSGFSNRVVIGNTVFFTSDDGVKGPELWKTDGTNAGTQLVKDIQTSSQNNPFPINNPTFVTLNGVLYFAASAGTSATAGGMELWRSDGTDAGTYRVADLNPGANAGYLGNLLVYNGALYFEGTNGTQAGLYASDGASVTLVKPLSIIYPSSIQILNGKMWFAASETGSGAGTEPYISDGTTLGTMMVKDVRSGTSSSVNFDFAPVAYNGEVYFAADVGAPYKQLWKSDGTAANTVVVKYDINTGPRNPSGGAVANGLLFFSANSNIGTELWRSDGTAAGTFALDIEPTGLSADPGLFIPFGSALLFHAAHSQQGGRELWRSDGTLAGTTRVKDIYAGNASSMTDSFLRPVVIGSKLYFRAEDYEHGQEPWVSDGTEAGTVMLADINTAPPSDYTVGYLTQPYLVGDNKRVFVSRNGAAGVELFVTDGVNASLVKDIYPGSIGSSPQNLMVHNGILYFVAEAPGSYREIWRSDGTEAGTFLLKDINPGMAGSLPTWFTGAGPYLYFRADSSGNNSELWRTDGTAAGTIQLGNINPTGSSTPANLFAFGNKLLYTAVANTTQGRELFISDGTPTGTGLVEDINDAPGANSDPSNFIMMNGYAYFSAYGHMSRELWRTDGTPAGTDIVVNVAPANAGSNPTAFTVVGSQLFFTANEGTTAGLHGTELWVTDGVNSHLVKDIVPGTGSPWLLNLTAFGDKLMFGVNSPGSPSLWTSDGTETGTVPFATLPDTMRPGGGGAPAATGETMFRGGDLFYFGLTNQGMWRTDGTPAGTVALNIATAMQTSFFEHAVYVNGNVYAMLRSSAYGWETAYSDGTPAGSGFIDVNPGLADGRPTSNNFATNIDGTLWFMGNDGTTGTSLFRLADFAEMVGGTLKVTAAPNGGSVSIAPSGTNAVVNRNGEIIAVPASGVTDIEIIGSAGNDSIALNVARPISFAGNGGADSITMGLGSYSTASDLGAGAGTVHLSVNSSASVRFDHTQHLHTLNLLTGPGGAAGAAAMSPGGAKVLSIVNLIRASNATLDLADNDLIIHAGSLATIENALKSAYSFGAWSGPGIRTSQTAATVDGLTTLAVARAGDVLPFDAGVDTALFSGETVSSNSVIVKYTYAGDVNFDGLVDAADYGVIDNFIQFPGASGYWNGDLNYDGIIDAADYGIIDNTIQLQGLPL